MIGPLSSRDWDSDQAEGMQPKAHRSLQAKQTVQDFKLSWQFTFWLNNDLKHTARVLER